jgi:hypothetical protein
VRFLAVVSNRLADFATFPAQVPYRGRAYAEAFCRAPRSSRTTTDMAERTHR